MKKIWFIIVFALISFLIFNHNPCSGPAEFKYSVIKIDSHFFDVAIADDQCTMSKGLMNQPKMLREGMLFIYDTPQQAKFWMKNTLIPISVAFADSSGTILEVIDMTVPIDNEYPIYFSINHEIKYALELDLDKFEKKQIKVGMKIDFPPDVEK